MMRLPPFAYRAPRTVPEAAQWLADSPGDTMLLAGGTDLLPNMKRRQQMPRTVVALRGIPELARLCREAGAWSRKRRASRRDRRPRVARAREGL